MKRHFITLAVLAFLVYGTARSQERVVKMNLDYSVAMPTGNLKSLIPNASGRGWGGGLSYGLTDRFSLGVGISFQDFYKKYPRQVLHQSGSDISAVVSYSIQTMPLMIKAKYRLTQGGALQPYAGLGVGGNYVRYRKFYGQFADSRSAFGFAAQPELGIGMPVGRVKTSGVHLAAGYNFMPFRYDDADGLHHAFVKAGFSFALR